MAPKPPFAGWLRPQGPEDAHRPATPGLREVRPDIIPQFAGLGPAGGSGPGSGLAAGREVGAGGSGSAVGASGSEQYGVGRVGEDGSDVGQELRALLAVDDAVVERHRERA